MGAVEAATADFKNERREVSVGFMSRSVEWFTEE
jgi:hypothetical protein